MYLIALTRWDPAVPIERDLVWLGQLMGLAPYDARLRLNAGAPVVLAREPELGAAQQSLAALRARGHGGVAIDERTVPSAERCPVPSGFELHAEQLVALERNTRIELPYTQLFALVRAVEVTEQEHAVEVVERKLALGRAVLTGGMMRSKTVRSTQVDKSASHEQIAYVFRRDSNVPLLLREQALSYSGLLDQRAPSARESFNRLIAALRQRAPHALADERLCARKRKLESVSIRGTTTDQTLSSSNAQAIALAGYLLAHAHLQGQL